MLGLSQVCRGGNPRDRPLAAITNVMEVGSISTRVQMKLI